MREIDHVFYIKDDSDVPRRITLHKDGAISGGMFLNGKWTEIRCSLRMEKEQTNDQ